MKFMSVKEALKKGRGSVALRGWVHRERGSNAFKFIVLRDSSDIIQCVIKKENVSEREWKDADKLLVESSIEITGSLKEDKRAPTGYEVQVEKLKVINFADVFPIKEDASEEFLLDKRHLWLRSRKSSAVMKIRSTVFEAIHEYFRSNGYYEFQSPTFTPKACEGGSTLFEVNYFGKKMYLT
ncbi:MAG: OB-fold nucleic acid binding domain-containing protein, partial [Nanoarchaeota archaeon]